MPNFRRLGAEAEDRAAKYLLSLGYTIVTRRFKGVHGEIDLVALDGETLVFVEVKFRRGKFMPEEQMDPKKAATLGRVIDEYMSKTGETKRPVRCDLIAVTDSEIRHHRGFI